MAQGWEVTPHLSGLFGLLVPKGLSRVRQVEGMFSQAVGRSAAAAGLLMSL